MTTENQPESAEVSIEKPAKIVETTEVDAAAVDTGDAQPDAATEAMAAEPQSNDE